MINVVINLFGALCMFASALYVWSKFYDRKIDFKDYKLYIVGFIVVLILIINYFYNNAYIRMLVITIVFSLANKIIFNEEINKTIVSTVMLEVLLSISDIIFALLVIYVIKVDSNAIPNFFGTLLANLFVLVVTILITNFKIVKKVYNKIVFFVDSVTRRKVIFFSLLIVITLNFLLALIYFELNIYFVFAINILLVIIYSYVIVKNLETTSLNAIIKSENQFLLDNLGEYENMLDRQRVDNHENKNQLLIIKNMINKNDKDVINYIDAIVKDKKEDDEILYTKVKKIPSGGLQGIIYQKMLVMRDKNILFNIEVSRDIRKIDMEKFNIDDNYKLCKIIGVFLDNAIEESEKNDDKLIIISLYEEDGMLVIEVSNKFDGEINLSIVDDAGFTTKGNGHGYGLSLVKKIISESNVFINERQVNNNIFKQVIKVKVK